MLKSTVGLSVSTQFLKALRQEIVDSLHDLPPRNWKRGVEVKNRRGEGPSLFFVRKTSASVVVHLGSSGPEIGKVRLNPDRNDGIQSAENYDQMQLLIEKLLENPEAAPILRQF
jgi:hypothetical protein